ncbi:MAG TPA: ABC transporter permease [Pyrinomonadaceae bacterium]|nr:ABC transporter permease [Pyrinomonadaceae bacterium]
MDTLIKDIRYALRSLIKQPTFTAIAVLTLALGIGANTTIFSVVNGLVLSSPAIADPDRVVAVWKTPTSKRVEGFVSYLDLQDWRKSNQTFADIAGYKANSFNLVDQGEGERVQGMRVTANFFPLLKVNLFRGRNFLEEEDQRNAPPVTIISYEFWQSRFAGNEAALNQQITLNGKPHTIVGILPPAFQFPLSVKDPVVWTTVTGEGSNLPERGAQVLLAVGRLKPGVSIERARADMVNVAAGLAQAYPQANRDSTIYLVSAAEQIVGKDTRKALWLLFGAVGLILLIACTNTANLLLVRATVRQKELAIRAALGAGTWRLARQLITESILLSLFAGAAGALMAVWGVGAIKYYGAEQLPRLDEVHINGRVLLFTFGVSLLTGFIFSLLPVFKVSRPEVNEVLKSGSKSATSGASLRLWRESLVVSEVALSLILLVGAGLMIRSFAQLVNVPPGFDPKNVLTGRISLTNPKYANTDERVLFINQSLEKLKALPGVESAAFVAPMPFSGGNVGGDFRIEGRPEPEPGREPGANVRSVTSQYFQSIKIPLLRGRYFTEQDKRGGVGAAIINQTLAQTYFANEDPIGKHISNIGANQNDGDPVKWEIVGIVGDVHHSSLTKAATPELYLPYQQNSWGWGNFMIRTTTNPASLSQSFREQIHSGDRTVPVTGVQPLAEAISATVAQPRFYTFLFGIFGGLGLLLSITGVYGLISYTVAQRTQEIGIRMALGATTQNVVMLVLWQGVALAVIGAVVGIGISFAMSRLISSLLFAVKPTDLLSFAISTAVLLFAALLASYIPARRVTKVDPLVALRYE